MCSCEGEVKSQTPVPKHCEVAERLLHLLILSIAKAEADLIEEHYEGVYAEERSQAGQYQ